MFKQGTLRIESDALLGLAFITKKQELLAFDSKSFTFILVDKD